MSQVKQAVVLITGCSSGIGRALALEFDRRGHRVFATARRPETLNDLPPNIARLPLDVTRADTIRAAVDAVIAQAGRIDVLVNNAGFGLMGPAVEIALDDVRRQFETNVVGALALVQAVAPHLAKQKAGRIVNVGSVSGVLTTPFAGPYCASKAALHALSDALRMELAPFGIHVVTLQPGGVVSRFGDTAEHNLPQLDKAKSLYGPLVEFFKVRAHAGQVGAITAEEFALHAVEAVMKEKPPAIFRRGPHSVRMPLFRCVLPAAAVDTMMSKKFGLHRLRPK